MVCFWPFGHKELAIAEESGKAYICHKCDEVLYIDLKSPDKTHGDYTQAVTIKHAHPLGKQIEVRSVLEYIKQHRLKITKHTKIEDQYTIEQLRSFGLLD